MPNITPVPTYAMATRYYTFQCLLAYLLIHSPYISLLCLGRNYSPSSEL